MFGAAKYDAKVQDSHLSFFLEQCARNLGIRFSPKNKKCGHWKSFMTDSGCPVEVSWDWGWSNVDPVVRYSMEPIGRLAGTNVNPLNRCAAPEFLRKLQKDFDIGDQQLLDHFAREILDGDATDYREIKEHSSEIFLAFDLLGSIINLKAYFIASRKAARECKSDFSVITEAIRKLPGYDRDLAPAMHSLTEFIAEAHQQDRPLEAEGLGIDCVALPQARYKIYLRDRAMTFDSVVDVVTLGGRHSSAEVAQSLKKLENLWRALLPQRGDGSRKTSGRRTDGVLYNFEIRPGRRLAIPKVYLPVRHYVESDAQVLAATRDCIISDGSEASRLEQFANFQHALSGLV